MAKDGRLKRFQDRIKIQIKMEIPKQQKKVLPASKGRMQEDRLTTGQQGNKTILEQNMATMRT